MAIFADSLLKLPDGLIIASLLAVIKTQSKIAIGLIRFHSQHLVELRFRIGITAGVHVGLPQGKVVAGAWIELYRFFVLFSGLLVTLPGKVKIPQIDVAVITYRAEPDSGLIGFNCAVGVIYRKICLCHVIGGIDGMA